MSIRIFNNYIQKQILLLALVEALVVAGSVYVGVFLRFGELAGTQDTLGALWPRALLIALVVFVSMLAMGLYHARLRPRKTGVLLRLALAFAFSSGLLVFLFYVFPSLFLGRGVMALTMGSAFVLTCIVRLLFYTAVDDSLFRRRVLVYGCGEKALSIVNMRRRNDQRGYRILGFVATDTSPPRVEAAQILGQSSELSRLARDHSVDEIVVAVDDRRKGFKVQALLDCKLNGVVVTDALTFFERETGKVKLDLLYPSWMIFSDGFASSPFRTLVERVFDIAVSLILLAVTWWIMLLVALAIKLEDGPRSPVFYRQQRVGFRGRLFEVLKFRSMTEDAEKDGVARWADEDDQRVTRIGSVIRKYRIDELPQILNVLRGDMSFVGPRPERPDFVDELSQRIPYYRERHTVKPGITGWAQLCYQYGSSQEDALEKLQYDLYYVKNRNLVFDLLILLQTAEVVLWKTGAR